MSTQRFRTAVVDDGIPFVGIMVWWIVITAIVYGAFILVWPSVPEAEPWLHLGVYLIPTIGYIGHTLHQALKWRRA